MANRKSLERLLKKYGMDTDATSGVRDLLTDVIAVCLTQGIDFDRAIDGAKAVAVEEAGEQAEVLPEGHPVCIATFFSQVYQNDCAVACDEPGEVKFDITRQVLAMGEEASKAIEDHDYDADNLWHDNKASSENEHDGPFEVEAADAIEEFWTNYHVWQAEKQIASTR